MADITIYHNPRCSKSRQTLELLEDRGIEPAVVDYLKDPPDAATLAALCRKLGIRPADLLRRKEPPFKNLNLADQLDDDQAILAAMAEYPVLIERPIVVKGNQARIGRPPQRVVEIL
jgi:arsenate reductase